MILTLFLTNQQLVAKSVHSGRDMNEELCKLVVIFAEFAIYNQQLGIMLGNLQNTSQIFQIARCPILLYHLWPWAYPIFDRLKVLGGRLDQFFGFRSSGAWLQLHSCKKKPGQIGVIGPCGRKTGQKLASTIDA